MPERTPTERALLLLELLQARRHWPGAELAARTGTDPRTLRRDVERLRDLGYRIAAVPGRHGGYALAGGVELPPLVLTPEEATAVMTALVGAADDATTAGESIATALGKVEAVMPAAVRPRLRAIRSAVALGAGPGVEVPDPQVLAVLALACRDGERVRIRYGDDEGVRRLEPVAVVPTRGRWYLVAWDLQRADWRVFRLDRIRRAEAAGVRATPPPLPAADAAAFVAARFTAPEPEVTATVRVHAPVEVVRDRLARYASGLEPGEPMDGLPTTRWRISAPRVEVLAGALTWLPWPYEVLESPALTGFLRRCAARFLAAAGDGPAAVDEG